MLELNAAPAQVLPSHDLVLDLEHVAAAAAEALAHGAHAGLFDAQTLGGLHADPSNDARLTLYAADLSHRDGQAL